MSTVIRENTSGQAIISVELHHALADFQYQEAELLDDWKFRDWLELIAEDIHYYMRSTTNAQTRDRRRSMAPPTTWIFNDSKFQLERRIARLETGMAWAEEPPSRTRHFVSNLRIKPVVWGDGYEVRSNYILYRSQKEKDETWYAGTRVDRVRQTSGRFGWEVYHREIVLDQVVIASHNLSVLF